MLAFLTTLVSFTTLGQTAQFKALFLYNFAQNISYPENSVKDNFIITVIGEPEVTKELQELSKSRKVGSYSLKIKETNAIENIEDSQIIYLSDNKSSQMPILQSYQKNKPVLIVGNQKGLHAQGAGISFITIDGKLRFEICPKNIESQKIKCSAKLLSLGIDVK
jgi:hypothetical protein